jgi:hypothetical protein
VGNLNDEGAIRIFIGTEPAQARAEKVLVRSIAENTKSHFRATFMRAGDIGFDWDCHGPTQFTMFRFAIPQLCGFRGMAIYLDCDQLVLGDIAELATYFQPGRWCNHPHREGDAVSVIDCHAVGQIPNWPTIEELSAGKLRKWDVRGRLAPIVSRSIPTVWNSMDKLEEHTRLVHFTDLATQPWHPDPGVKYKQHPDQAAVDRWHSYERLTKLRGVE